MVDTPTRTSATADAPALDTIATPALRISPAIYAEGMGELRPARTVVPVPELHYGYLVEIDAIAVRTRAAA